jgi:hypothetical protein
MHHYSINLYITTITTTTTNTMSIPLKRSDGGVAHAFKNQAEYMAYLMNEKKDIMLIVALDTLKNYQDLMDKIDALVPEDERNSDWEEGGTIKGLYEYIKNLREEAAELPDEE